MKKLLNISLTGILAMMLLLPATLLAQSFPLQKCRFELGEMTGNYLSCLRDRDDGFNPLRPSVDAEFGSWLGAKAGTVTISNNCKIDLKLMSRTNSTIDGDVIDAGKSKVLQVSDLNTGAANTIMVAPVTSATQCSAIDCGSWTAIQYSPAPPQANTTQRDGSMWASPNLLYAAYCQPTNAGAIQCNDTSTTPCCGTSMNYDRTFGTTWELTPGADVSGSIQDFIDLSTNYGSGPDSPPTLCTAPGADPNNCVDVNANIFFNVPVSIVMSGGDCSCGNLGSRSKISCTAVSCSDAYQYPEDHKQCSCSSGGKRAYVVTYCPKGSPLPAIPDS